MSLYRLERREEVAARCGVEPEHVEPLPARAVRDSLRGKIDRTVLEIATAEPAAYWRCGERIFLDDPYFGPVADFADLRYSPELGLYNSRMNAECG